MYTYLAKQCTLIWQKKCTPILQKQMCTYLAKQCTLILQKMYTYLAFSLQFIMLYFGFVWATFKCQALMLFGSFQIEQKSYLHFSR